MEVLEILERIGQLLVLTGAPSDSAGKFSGHQGEGHLCTKSQVLLPMSIRTEAREAKFWEQCDPRDCLVALCSQGSELGTASLTHQQQLGVMSLKYQGLFSARLHPRYPSCQGACLELASEV